MSAMVRLISVVSVVVGGLAAGSAFAEGAAPARLRCEYRTNPLGIDTMHPRLSWIMPTVGRGQIQTAYQVLVASSAERLAAHDGDLWNTGKVESEQSIQILYAGGPLKPDQRCFWKVRTWDQDKQVSAWSEPASWTMGMWEADQWTARWIGAASPALPVMDECRWIWFSEGEPRTAAPAATRWFRKRFVIASGRAVKRALFIGTADNHFVLWVNGQRAGGGDSWQSASPIDVTAMLRPGGENVLAIAAINDGPQPNPAGVIGQLIVEFESGEPLVVRTDASWHCTDREQPDWMSPTLEGEAKWPSTKDLGLADSPPWAKPRVTWAEPLPLFRREFEIDRPVARAHAYVCGLGFHELRINGGKVGENVLEPGWTDYRDRCQYVTYDVTEQLRAGRNAIGILLGNGMYNVVGGRYTKFTGSFGPPKCIMELHVEFTDGRTTRIVTDASWRAAPGPITFTCIYGGEDHDARREPRGWSEAGFDDSSWAAAVKVEGPGGKLVAQNAPPIQVMQRFNPVRVTEPRPGLYVYDLGQNFSGWPQIRVVGPAGSTVRMIPAELLDEQGLASQKFTGAPCWFQYTLSGQGEETWHPRFTYSGFRYVQIEGATRDESGVAADKPRLLDVEGQFVHAAVQTVGSFACSNRLFERIHEIITAAIRSNMQSVFTDCPHREKLGWLEEAHLMAPSIMYNYDVASLYGKISDDMGDAQLDSGLVPDIAPEYTVFSDGFRDSPEWGSAVVLAPYFAFEFYGDRRIVEEHYDQMKRYVDYLGSKATDHIVSHGLGDWCDIGPAPYGPSQLTPIPLTATATYCQDLAAITSFAMLLDKDSDVDVFAVRSKAAAEAFNKTFFNDETNQYATGSQTANAMPLVLGLVPADRVPAVLDNLVKDVRAHGNHLTAGDAGHRYLVQALATRGRSDVLYDMTSRTDPPSYGFQVEHGVTTLTETWDPRLGFSQNHFMMGHIEEWFYSGLAGIKPDPSEPGFVNTIIKPQVMGDVTSVRGTYDSIYGSIVSEWKREGQSLTLNVAIPANTTATVFVPAIDKKDVTEGGVPADQAFGVKFLRIENDAVVYDIGSGEYRFVTRLADRVQLSGFNPAVITGLDIICYGDQIEVRPGEAKVGEKTVVAAGAEVKVEPSDMVSISNDRLTLTAGPVQTWRGGNRLPIAPTDRRNLLNTSYVPGSLEVAPLDTPEQKLVSGKDFVVDDVWGAFAIPADGKLKAAQTVAVSYRMSLRRVDALVLDRIGRVQLIRGEPAPDCPNLPDLPQDAILLANIHRPFQATQVEPHHVYVPAHGQAESSSLQGTEMLGPVLEKLRTGKDVTVVCWGDSVTEAGDVRPREGAYVPRFEAQLKERFPAARIQVINAGIGGTSTTNRFGDFQKEVLDHHPDLVTLEFVNDMGVPRDQLMPLYGQILQRLRENGAGLLIITPHFVMPSWMPLPNGRGKDARQGVAFLRDFARDNKVPLADAARRWEQLESCGVPYEVLLINGINHPDARGHQIFVEELMRFFPATRDFPASTDTGIASPPQSR